MNEEMKRISSKQYMFAILLAVAAIAIVIGYSIKPAPVSLVSPVTTEAQRVQKAFREMSIDVAKKDRLASVKLTALHAGVELIATGTVASVWVTGPTPKGVHSRCVYVDISTSGSVFTSGLSACGGPGRNVSLNRFGSAVVGDIESIPTKFVVVSVGDLNFQVPVTSGYFVVPVALSRIQKAVFTISFTESGGSTCKVTNLVAPGSSATMDCVIT